MKSRYLLAIFAAIALTAAVGAQDGSSAPQAGQNAGSGQGGGQIRQQRGGRGGFGGGMMGRGMMGTVTEAAADHYTIKTEAGEVYAVHLSSDTRILKQVAGMRGPGGGGGMGQGADQGAGGGNGGGGRSRWRREIWWRDKAWAGAATLRKRSRLPTSRWVTL